MLVACSAGVATVRPLCAQDAPLVPLLPGANVSHTEELLAASYARSYETVGQDAYPARS